MATNPLLALIAPALTQALTQVQVAAANVAATPTIENVNNQVQQLELEALNLNNFEGVSISGAAQEVANIAASLLAQLNAATAAPSAAQTPAAQTPAAS